MPGSRSPSASSRAQSATTKPRRPTSWKAWRSSAALSRRRSRAESWCSMLEEADMTDDREAIRLASQTYLDGLHEGDADKLAAVFHPTSALTWEDGGGLVAMPRDKWLGAVMTQPSAKARGLSRHDEILQIDQSSPTSAFVKL